MLVHGHIAAGDILICDNAAIHKAAKIQDRLTALMDAFNFEIRFMPAYSPECNPCELCFAKAKQWLRSYRSSNAFLNEIDSAFASVTFSDVANYYHHCLTFHRRYL